MSYGIIVGRFQTDGLHGAHVNLIDDAIDENDGKVLIFIGTIDGPPTAKDPLSFEQRKQMILDFYSNWDMRHVQFFPIRDHHSDYVWSENLDNYILGATMGEGGRFYVGRYSFEPHYFGRYEFERRDYGINEVSASSRREFLRDHPIYSQEFRAGVIHARYTAWHRTYQTVDMALVQRVLGGEKLLLVKKKGYDKWHLPGGFVNAGETYAEAAEREMQEECNIGSAVGWEFIQDLFIDDHRVRGVPLVDHKTHLMLGYVPRNSKDPSPGDDIIGGEVKWFWSDTLRMNIDQIVAHNHRKLVEIALDALNEKNRK